MTKKLKTLSLLVILAGGMQVPTLSAEEKSWFTEDHLLLGSTVVVAMAWLAGAYLAGAYIDPGYYAPPHLILHEAVCNGELEVVKDLIKKGEKISKENVKDAIGHGHLNIVKFLFENSKFDINFKDSYGEIPLHWAAQKGYFEIVKYLITQTADINSKNSIDRIPLHYAARKGHFEVVKFLVEHGADINASDTLDRTPLSVALLEMSSYEDPLRFMDIVKYLIDRVKDNTATLCDASCWGALEVVKYIIVERSTDVNAKYNGETALHYAAREGHFEVVKFLVEHDADINATTNSGKTSLALAKKEGQKCCAEYLQMVADLHQLTNKKPVDESNALAENKKNSNGEEIVYFVQKYLSTQALIDKNLTDIVQLAHSKFEIFEKLFTDKVFSQKNIQLKAFGSPLCPENVGKNVWYLMLLRIATLTNNEVLAQHIIANKPELWDIVDKIFFGKTLPELIDKELESEAKKFKKALFKADKEKFKKPFFRFMKTKAYLDGNHQKTSLKWQLPRELSAEILKFCGPFDGKTVKE